MRRLRGGNDRRNLPRQDGAQSLALLTDQIAELLHPKVPDHELEASEVPVLPVAGPVEHPDDGCDRDQQVVGRSEVLQELSDLRRWTQTASHVEVKSVLAPPVLATRDRDGPDVLDGREAAVVLASGEADLELPGQILVHRVAKEKAGRRLRIRRDIEGLLGGDARVRAGDHVAHRVPAGLASGEAYLRQSPERGHQRLRLHEVKLDVLAGGDVSKPPGGLLGQFGQTFELSPGEAAPRDLHPNHVDAFLPLAIHAVLQAKSLELIRRDLASPKALNEKVKRVNLVIVRPGVGFGNDLPWQFIGFRNVKTGLLRLACRVAAHRPLQNKEANPTDGGIGLQLTGQPYACELRLMPA